MNPNNIRIRIRSRKHYSLTSERHPLLTGGGVCAQVCAIKYRAKLGLVKYTPPLMVVVVLYVQVCTSNKVLCRKKLWCLEVWQYSRGGGWVHGIL